MIKVLKYNEAWIIYSNISHGFKIKKRLVIHLNTQAAGEFWAGRNGWYPTWQAAGENAALQVDYVRIWAL